MQKKRSALNLQPPGWRSVSCAFWGNPSTMMRFCVTKIRSRTFSPGKSKKAPTHVAAIYPFLSEAIVQNVELQFLLRILTGQGTNPPIGWCEKTLRGLRKMAPWDPPIFSHPFGESRYICIYYSIQLRTVACISM